MERELARVLSHYALGELRAAQRVERGFINEKWMVETTCGRCFLKRRHPDLRRPDFIRAQHDLIKWLRQADFPAAVILPTLSGETFLVLGGEFYEIYDYIEGKPYDHDRPEHLEEAARTLGRYHASVKGFASQVLRDLGAVYSPVTLNATLARLRASWQLDQDSDLVQMVRELEAQAADLAAHLAGHGALPHLVIHGDYYAGNLLFDGDCIVGVVDYDKARWQPRVLEVAEALIYFARERSEHFKHIVYSGVLDLGVVHQFLAAYVGMVSLSESEMRALPHWMRTIWLCASLDPPLEPLMSLEAAAQALPEVLALGGWAQAHGSDIVEIALTAQKEHS
jgi:homoserine kinase type II